jgi:hypothetical protein
VRRLILSEFVTLVGVIEALVTHGREHGLAEDYIAALRPKLALERL